MKRNRLYALVAAALLSTGAFDTAYAQSQTTAFTYQGQLNASGAFPTGEYLFTFTLFDASSGGTMIGSPVSENVQVISGLFTVDLDFGSAFGPTQYWLEISVNGQVLANRQRVNSVPVADYALGGNAGPAGATGPQGAAGPQGATGADGVQGPQGGPGAQGPQGQMGLTGDTGVQGAQGPQGIDGAQGPQGSIGPTGATGLTWQGTWGATAMYNPDDAVFFGGSSYIALLANSGDEPDTSVTEADGNWELLAMQGASGATGAQGPAGATGAQGSQGDPGNQGSQGQQGPMGPQGQAGATGATGADGTPGTNGATGPQGVAGATGATGPTGTGPNLPVGVARSTTVTQTFPVPNAFQNVQLMSNSYLSGFTLSPTSAFIVNRAGVYRVSYIATPKSSSLANVTVSARVTDNLVADSNLVTTTTLLGNQSGVLTAEDILSLNAGDTIQLQISASTANVVTLPTGSNTSLMLIALDVTP